MDTGLNDDNITDTATVWEQRACLDIGTDKASAQTNQRNKNTSNGLAFHPRMGLGTHTDIRTHTHAHCLGDSGWHIFQFQFHFSTSVGDTQQGFLSHQSDGRIGEASSFFLFFSFGEVGRSKGSCLIPALGVGWFGFFHLFLFPSPVLLFGNVESSQGVLLFPPPLQYLPALIAPFPRGLHQIFGLIYEGWLVGWLDCDADDESCGLARVI